ncbi:short chain dehydrogenase [Novosphingobium sp. B1]|nr:short chain dehydrogenase [Novosphingobium sp. B1]
MTGLFDLAGKTAIVTGSTRGIGRAIAEALITQGARVLISSESLLIANLSIRRGGHRQRCVEVFVLDDRRLIYLPDLVVHPVRQDMVAVPDLKAAIGILADLDPLAGDPPCHTQTGRSSRDKQ